MHLLARDSTLLPSSAHLQQGVRLACSLLCRDRGSALSSASAPALVARLAELVAPGATAAPARRALDPQLLPLLASSLPSPSSLPELTRPTVLLLLNLAAPPPLAPRGPPPPLSGSGSSGSREADGALRALRAAAAAAAGKLLAGWEPRRLPRDLGTLLLLPSLSKAAGAPLMRPGMQEAMEGALVEKARASQVKAPEQRAIFEQVCGCFAARACLCARGASGCGACARKCTLRAGDALVQQSDT